MSAGAGPDWSTWLASTAWPGSGDQFGDPAVALIQLSSNVVIGSNPPFYIQDYLQMYPKWGGTPKTYPTITITANTDTVTIADSNGLAVGNPVFDNAAYLYIPDGAYITGISDGTLTLSANAAQSGTIQLTVWNAPLVPFVILNLYISLASASLVQARWQDSWMLAMGLFVSHFATLFAKSDGPGASSAAQAAAQGLSNGILTSKSAGDVSVGYQAVQGIEDWGAFNLTAYGQQLATLGRLIGNGPVLLW